MGKTMAGAALFILLALTAPVQAQQTKESTAAVGSSKTRLKFKFENQDLTQVIGVYAKASGQKIIVSPGVNGKATILSSGEVTLNEAFALLSSALATNGYAISEQGDTLVVMAARNIQRSLIPVLTEVPPLQPERMVTVVFNLKHTKAEDINKYLRIIPSKDGEMSPYEPTNKLIVCDWVSNIHKVAKLIAELDQAPAVK